MLVAETGPLLLIQQTNILHKQKPSSVFVCAAKLRCRRKVQHDQSDLVSRHGQRQSLGAAVIDRHQQSTVSTHSLFQSWQQQSTQFYFTTRVSKNIH